MTTETITQYLHDNDKVVNFRVNSDLYQAYRDACISQGLSISMSIREFMIGTVLAQEVAVNGLQPDDITSYISDMADIIGTNRLGGD